MIEYENLRKSNEKFYSEYRESFENTLESGWFILGERVKTFENEFAAYIGNKHCVGVANGLDALIICLKSLDIEKGSEVIVPSNTYIATILSVLNCGLIPVLVEPDIKTYNMDPLKVEEKISDKTKAIMVVHLYGKSCDMDPISALCDKYSLHLIEDCAQSHGAKYKNKTTGTFGVMSAFSFYPTKNLGALGDGGSVNTDDEALCETVKKYRNYGSLKKYINEIIGVNSRLDEIQAGFLSVELKHLDMINSHKRKLAGIYLKNLKDDFIKPEVHDDYYDVYHIFNVRHPQRDRLKEYLLDNGIKTDIHYPMSPHRQKAMDGFFDGQKFPVSDEIHNTTLSLPVSYCHSEDDLYRVIEIMNKF